MIVAVTGGTGFIGRRIAQRHLALGHEVRVLTRNAATVERLLPGARACVTDLRNPDVAALGRFVIGADILYHCAGEIGDVSAMRAVNVCGTESLARVAKGRIGTWVQLSSVGVYGRAHSGVVTEALAPSPQNAYERSKADADAVVMEFAEQGAFPCTLLRPSIVIGADMPARWLSHMIDMIARGFFFYIGKSGASANFVAVDNVVEALAACARRASDGVPARVFNLSDWMTIESFVEVLAAELGCRPPSLRLPEWLVRGATSVAEWSGRTPLTSSRIDALTTRVRYPTERIESELDYRPRISLPDVAREIACAWKTGRPT